MSIIINKNNEYVIRFGRNLKRLYLVEIRGQVKSRQLY
jgi:hypothetical protein